MNAKKILVSELKGHPFQDSVYLSEPAAKIKELASDIKRNGQRVPIEITPDKTILDGHGRVEAVKELGHGTILAVEIDVTDEFDMRRRHLEANINRRHMEKIDIVRLVKARLELEQAINKNYRSHVENLREKIAEALGQSKTDITPRRYTRMVLLPDLIQLKFKLGELKLMTALKFDTLEQDRQNELLELIKSGQVSPAEAFEQYFPTASRDEEESEQKSTNPEPEEGAEECECPTEQLANDITWLEEQVGILIEETEELPAEMTVDGWLRPRLSDLVQRIQALLHALEARVVK